MELWKELILLRQPSYLARMDLDERYICLNPISHFSSGINADYLCIIFNFCVLCIFIYWYIVFHLNINFVSFITKTRYYIYLGFLPDMVVFLTHILLDVVLCSNLWYYKSRVTVTVVRVIQLYIYNQELSYSYRMITLRGSSRYMLIKLSLICKP